MPLLYLDDVINIERVFNESNPKNFKIITDEYEFDSTSEIKSENKQLKQLEIRSFSPFVTLSLDKDSAYLSCLDDDINTVGLVSKINSLMSTYQQKRQWFIIMVTPIICPVIMYIFLMAIVYILKKQSTTYFLVIPFIVTFISSTILYIMNLKKSPQFSVIKLTYRNQESNFFSRNKDQVVLSIISALIGSIFTVLAGIIFNNP